MSSEEVGIHGIGQATWDLCDRKLDALFVIYVLGWQTRANKYSPIRYFARQISNNEWVSEMLPYIHDDIRYIFDGIEIFRKNEIFVTVQSTKDGYRAATSGKLLGLSVEDNDPNFAIMALLLLARGVEHKDIQNALDKQIDYSKRSKIKKRVDNTRV